MQMKVKHGLPRATSVIDNGAVAVGQLAVYSEFCGDQLQTSQHRGVLGRSFRERNQMFLGQIKMWTGACGWISSNANISSFSYTSFAGISFRLILQNRQSSMRTPRSTELTVEVWSGTFFNSFHLSPRSLVWSSRTTMFGIRRHSVIARKVLRGVGIWNTAYAHAVKMSVGRIKILIRWAVARQQAFAQALGIGVIGNAPTCTVKFPIEGLGPESISMRTGAVPVPIMSRH